LICSNNQITFLPPLPDTLHYLDCSINQLVMLPDLPATLEELRVSQNQLIALPALPTEMTILFVDSNPSLGCLPLVHVAELHWSNTAIRCIPEELSAGIAVPPIDTLPECYAGNPGNCEVYWNIQGSIYGDSILNCQLDSAEMTFPHIKVNLYRNGSMEQQTLSNLSGHFAFDTDSGIFVTRVDTAGVPYVIVCPAAGEYPDTITASDPFLVDRDFSLACKPGFDIEAFGARIPVGGMRPVAQHWYVLWPAMQRCDTTCTVQQESGECSLSLPMAP